MRNGGRGASAGMKYQRYGGVSEPYLTVLWEA